LTKVNYYAILQVEQEREMKVLVKIHRSPEHRFLVDLRTKKLIKEVNILINRGRHSKALVTVLSKGKLLKVLPESDLTELKADLILSETYAYRCLL